MPTYPFAALSKSTAARTAGTDALLGLAGAGRADIAGLASALEAAFVLGPATRLAQRLSGYFNGPASVRR